LTRWLNKKHLMNMRSTLRCYFSGLFCSQLHRI